MGLDKIILGVALGILTVPASFQYAKSDALPAWGGRPQNLSADLGCFAPVGFAGVRNNCNGTPRGWYVTVQNHFGTGQRTFRAVAETRANFETAPSCRADVVSPTSALLVSTGFKAVSGDTLLGNLTSSSTNNTFQFYCDVAGPDAVGKALFSFRVT